MRFAAKARTAVAATAILIAGGAMADDGLNQIISGETGTAPAETAETAATDGTAEGATDAATDAARADDERWVTAENPTGNLRLITIRPLPGETCAQVLLEHRPNQRLRLEPQPGETLQIDMSDLCVLGLRNDAEGRALAIRLGEGLRTIAITSDTRLYAGLTLQPGHEILTPLRPIAMAELTIDVETAWDDALDTAAPEGFRILLTQSMN